MENISMDKISELLNSPDLMKNIQSALSQLNVGGAKEEMSIVESVNSQQNDINQIMETLSSSGILSSVSSFLSSNKTERIALLTALRPFLNDEKKVILDSILQILKFANVVLATNLLKGG